MVQYFKYEEGGTDTIWSRTRIEKLEPWLYDIRYGFEVHMDLISHFLEKCNYADPFKIQFLCILSFKGRKVRRTRSGRARELFKVIGWQDLARYC